MNERLKAKRDHVKQVETLILIPSYESIKALDIQWARLQTAHRDVVLPQEQFDVVDAFRELSCS